MSPTDEARKWADLIVLAHMSGPGDTISRATRRASDKTGVPKALINRLRYKHPSDIWVSEYFQIRDAWTAVKAKDRW
jgi:hypothetical protein